MGNKKYKQKVLNYILFCACYKDLTKSDAIGEVRYDFDNSPLTAGKVLHLDGNTK